MPVLGGGSAAAYVTLKAAPATDTSQVHCYARASLSSDGQWANGTEIGQPGTAPSSGLVPIRHAMAACGALWRSGVLPDPRHYTQPDAAHPVPALVGCVLPDGTAAIFPGPADTCARLGLPRLTSARSSTR